MKKLLSLALTAAVTLALLSACGGKQDTPGSSGQVPESTSQSQPQVQYADA